MKGGFYEMRSKQTSAILIALVCTTILVWAWKKPPLLTSLFPPQGSLWQLSLVRRRLTFLLRPGPQVQKDIEVSPKFGKTNNVTKKHLANGISDQESVNEHVDAAAMSPAKSGHESKERSNLVESVASNITSPSVKEQENKNSTTSSQSQACNFAKGKWVIDNNRPLYSGFGCKQWLSKTWACRQTHRTDYGYEALRWQPTDCVTEEFTGHKFLDRMQNKTLAFVGDSLGAEQCQSLMCMITGGRETPQVLDVGSEYGLDKPHGAVQFNGWAYRFTTTNTTILFYWSTSLCDLEPRATYVAMHLDRPPAFLQRHVSKFDVLVLNTWDHWTTERFKANRWVMHVGGVPNTNGKDNIAGAMNFTIHGIVRWVDSQVEKYRGLKAFYRSLSPRHFSSGEWNSGGTCDNTTPLVRGNEVFKDEPVDSVASSAVKGTKVKLLDITALSELRDEGHISKYSKKARPGVQDCLHWCLPGVPDTWNEILFAQL